MTSPSRVNPSWSGLQRAQAKKRCARLGCHTPFILETVSIPHTVRRAGAAMRPVTSVVKVSNPREVKQGLNAHSSCVKDEGMDWAGVCDIDEYRLSGKAD